MINRKLIIVTSCLLLGLILQISIIKRLQANMELINHLKMKEIEDFRIEESMLIEHITNSSKKKNSLSVYNDSVKLLQKLTVPKKVPQFIDPELLYQNFGRNILVCQYYLAINDQLITYKKVIPLYKQLLNKIDYQQEISDVEPYLCSWKPKGKDSIIADIRLVHFYKNDQNIQYFYNNKLLTRLKNTCCINKDSFDHLSVVLTNPVSGARSTYKTILFTNKQN